VSWGSTGLAEVTGISDGGGEEKRCRRKILGGGYDVVLLAIEA